MSANGRAREEFQSTAQADTKHGALEALNNLCEEYKRQSEILAKVAMGKTSLGSGEQELVMADKMRAHLKNLGFQIHVHSLICARLDGVNVQPMIDDIQKLIDTGISAPDFEP